LFKNAQYAIDANSDWTPEVALQFLDILRPIKKFIFMIEQPFPVTLVRSIHGDGGFS
jgi:L-alanine-DL-glutamate epimerase-like enolase superfamily enzyme